MEQKEDMYKENLARIRLHLFSIFGLLNLIGIFLKGINLNCKNMEDFLQNQKKGI